ncbi:MAG TPA: DUF4124 domain-containing protein [Steroidobacteraceae bacterium]|jgi:hypothetical protein|nr:DUF4124 domain-containing protein [Steroidobacteraceae bacterium]
MRRISIALAALAAVVTAANADVYKTVDAQGQVHYSDQWSLGAELIKSDHSHSVPGPAEAPAPGPNDHTLAPDAGKAAAAKQVQSDMAALHAEQCKQLKEQYDKVMRARRIYQPGGDSSAPKQYMSDADADAERVKTRQAMDEACAGGASS